ncbi:hypothetical protein [Thiohalocapsa halophila]|uniref:hypothetical protein n=1 Tax=Thiohalocapsa halophila TaxID=69359 RepID=UPI00190497C4|nr:hypothetical protein [Thiohalocapsa halophila]
MSRSSPIQQAVHEHPIVAQGLARWNATLLMPTPLPQYKLVGKGAALTGLDDFSGLRVRGPGGVTGVLGKLGARRPSWSSTPSLSNRMSAPCSWPACCPAPCRP